MKSHLRRRRLPSGDVESNSRRDPTANHHDAGAHGRAQLAEQSAKWVRACGRRCVESDAATGSNGAARRAIETGSSAEAVTTRHLPTAWPDMMGVIARISKNTGAGRCWSS